ncbi:hypothetical protein MMC13_007565 [Lambiella insularis]|nr:hypothetical protein [Lambiella insularis]
MGQSYSKEARRGSASSQAPLYPDSGYTAEKVHETFYSSVNPKFVDQPSEWPTSISTITRPARHTHQHRVSELIDPHELLGLTADDIQSTPYMYYPPGNVDRNKRLPRLVESPSGTILDAQEFIAHPNRPLAIRERQESIKRALEQASRNGSVSSGSYGSVGSERNGSVSTTGSMRAFEQGRIEEGRIAYAEKMKTKHARGASRGHGCFRGCFGTQD